MDESCSDYEDLAERDKYFQAEIDRILDVIYDLEIPWRKKSDLHKLVRETIDAYYQLPWNNGGFERSSSTSQDFVPKGLLEIFSPLALEAKKTLENSRLALKKQISDAKN